MRLSCLLYVCAFVCVCVISQRYVNGSASGQSDLSGQDLFALYKWLRTNLCAGQATCEDASRVGELCLRVIREAAGKGSM